MVRLFVVLAEYPYDGARLEFATTDLDSAKGFVSGSSYSEDLTIYEVEGTRKYSAHDYDRRNTVWSAHYYDHKEP